MYFFAFKIIFAILNKSTQYISFIAISMFLSVFLLTDQSLITYQEKFINSLKGLYPEFVTNSSSTLKKLRSEDLDIVKEIFVYSEEIMFSYGGYEDVSKFMNVRTYDSKHKDTLFSTIDTDNTCAESDNIVWLSNRLYKNMLQDSAFDKKHMYFVDINDELKKYDVCTFDLANDEKWLVTSTKNAKQMAYMPLPTNTIYTDDLKLKSKLYDMKKINNWKKYIDYDDLGVFLLAKQVSSSFLFAFFIFLIIFMFITFSSLAKEFEAGIFLKKIYGMTLFKTIILFSLFFFFYVSLLTLIVYLEYELSSLLLLNILGVKLVLSMEKLGTVFIVLVLIGSMISAYVSKKYHRLPL